MTDRYGAFAASALGRRLTGALGLPSPSSCAATPPASPCSTAPSSSSAPAPPPRTPAPS